jgi:hypothetical protein
MRHIPAYCPDTIMNVRPGDTLASCDWKEIIYLGKDRFMIWYKPKGAKPMRKRGFAQARQIYNSLEMPTTLKK